MTLDKFLLFLEREEVKNKIQEICGVNNQRRGIRYERINDENYKSDIEKLKGKLSRKEKELEDIKREYEELKETCRKDTNELKEKLFRKDKELEDIKREYEELKETCRKDTNELKEKLSSKDNELAEIKKKFKKHLEVFYMYSELSDITKKGLSAVVKDDNVVCFIISCAKADNLKRIWDYTKEVLNDESRTGDVNILKKIFEYAFELVNTSSVEPVYKMENVVNGMYYDDELHCRGKNSATAGVISRVLLLGYRNTNTGQVICKSVVEV